MTLHALVYWYGEARQRTQWDLKMLSITHQPYGHGLARGHRNHFIELHKRGRQLWNLSASPHQDFPTTLRASSCQFSSPTPFPPFHRSLSPITYPLSPKSPANHSAAIFPKTLLPYPFPLALLPRSR